jgi:DNA polymerase-3 subunit delta'
VNPPGSSGLERYGWPPPPRVNSYLVGHEDAERQLLTAFRSGRLPHAWLITGPRGIGKATLAFRFARFVLSMSASRQEPDMFGLSSAVALETGSDSLYVDPERPVFRRVASEGHADLLTLERRVDPKRGKLRTEISVDDVRNIGGFLFSTSAEGGWRVVVVDCVDDMNRNAANALLKVLEEPPANALLLLVSHNPGRLLETIRSRCRLLALKPLAVSTVVALIGEYLPDLSQDEATKLVCLSENSIGRALNLAEHGGLALHSELMDLLANLPTVDAVALHRLGDKLAKSDSDEHFLTVTELLCGWLARLIRCAAAGTSDVISESEEPREERLLLQQLAPAATLDRWLDVWEKTGRLLARVDSANMDRKQVLLTIFLDLATAIRP